MTLNVTLNDNLYSPSKKITYSFIVDYTIYYYTLHSKIARTVYKSFSFLILC